MATRISGINLDDGWRVDFALTKIKGIGWALSEKILSELKIENAKRVKELSPEEVAKISSKMEEFQTEGDLVRVVRGNIQRLKVIGSYRGHRHSANLPARGQRTRTNARTKRGSRKTVGAFKKEQLAKMQQAAK